MPGCSGPLRNGSTRSSPTPPFGGKEGSDTQSRFPFKTGATQVLFLQQVMDELAEGGRCAIVLDEGLLFRTNERAFVETKRRLLDECDLWCVLSLPGGVFSAAGAGVKTNLLFFTKGRSTRRIWYYDLSGVRVGKKQPLTLAHFGFGRDSETLDDGALPTSLPQLLADTESEQNGEYAPFPSFSRLLPVRGTPEGESPLSWTLDVEARRAEAREAMAPHLKEAERQRSQAIHWRTRVSALRRDKSQESELETALRHLPAAEREAREAQTRADAIDAAVFDLKAVNPRARADRDMRGPEQVLAAIAEHQRIIDSALRRLKRLLEQPASSGTRQRLRLSLKSSTPHPFCPAI
jgi:type I restriction enzyme M protein